MYRLVVVALLARVLAGPELAAGAGGEQAVIAIEPTEEQRIEGVGGEAEQRVEALTAEQAEQAVNGAPPKSGVQRAASTAGKVALGVMAAAVSIGFMAASLLLF